MDAVKLLGSLLGNNATGGNVLGSLLGGGGGGAAGGGGLGGLVGSLLGGGGGAQQAQQQAPAGGGLGGLLGGLLGGGGQQAQQRAPQQQEADQAVVLIRSMVNAAKADGKIDEEEIKNIVGRLGEIDQNEAAFLKQELQAPLDVASFCRQVPADFTQQAYAFSVMGMRLDTQQEAQYLASVAQGLNLTPDICNAIHAKIGAPQIFGR